MSFYFVASKKTGRLILPLWRIGSRLGTYSEQVGTYHRRLGLLFGYNRGTNLSTLNNHSLRPRLNGGVNHEVKKGCILYEELINSKKTPEMCCYEGFRSSITSELDAQMSTAITVRIANIYWQN